MKSFFSMKILMALGVVGLSSVASAEGMVESGRGVFSCKTVQGSVTGIMNGYISIAPNVAIDVTASYQGYVQNRAENFTDDQLVNDTGYIYPATFTFSSDGSTVTAKFAAFTADSVATKTVPKGTNQVHFDGDGAASFYTCIANW